MVSFSGETGYLIPENPMELTTFLPKAMNKIRIGRAAIRVAAISPLQSGAPYGDWDLKTLKPTVRTRTFSS